MEYGFKIHPSPQTKTASGPAIAIKIKSSCADLIRVSIIEEVIMSGGWVYIMTNKPHGALYVGVTADLPRRIWQHRERMSDGFTKRYNLERLVFAEHHDLIAQAIQREKLNKHWPRAWKVELICELNPDWHDLYETIL